MIGQYSQRLLVHREKHLQSTFLNVVLSVICTQQQWARGREKMKLKVNNDYTQQLARVLASIVYTQLKGVWLEAYLIHIREL